ncbi:FIG00986352: hypothetical protein [hydrothermal vent metagenome]|uniref:Saccharopine dehydrogenase n=1 Tax=hydrothermal vent metagenome TaxID=652676 RepID=A0A3B0RMI3_9ZZZZ
MKIVILGGYGVFGGRLAKLLADMDGLEMVICGRNPDRAQVFCEGFAGKATVTPMRLDRLDIAAVLPQLKPDFVIDASGPFQDYGDDPYVVVKASIAAGVNYMDFADAADFVFGISQFDAAAAKARISVLSGVSSFPVLTAAVLREISKDLQIKSVRGGIAPSPYAGVGMNVIRAVVGYAGGPVKLYRGGKLTQAYGLAESLRYTVAVPGHMPLRNIRFSLVDVPDLQVIPPEHAGMEDIWMGAGPLPESLHRMLNMLAKLRAKLHLPSYAPLAPLFYRVLNLMKFGEHRGGMFIEAEGLQDGQARSISWHMLAEGDDGPYIPSMAIEALIRKADVGDMPMPGARPATGALEISDYDKLFDGRHIISGFRSEPVPESSLYKRVLGPAFEQLPAPVARLHALDRERRWTGSARVQRGRSILARAIARLIGFPPGTDNIPVAVTLKPERDGERWIRQFGDAQFQSFQRPGQGRMTHLLEESFGMVTVALALVIKEGRLYLIPRHWRIFGVPMPKFLLPEGNSFEHADQGRFNFDVTIKVPLIGLIVSYQGFLKPV